MAAQQHQVQLDLLTSAAAALQAGRYNEAKDLYDQVSANLAEAADEPSRRLLATSNLGSGECLLWMHQFDACLAKVNRAAELGMEMGEVELTARARYVRGVVHTNQGDVNAALLNLNIALALTNDLTLTNSINTAIQQAENCADTVHFDVK